MNQKVSVKITPKPMVNYPILIGVNLYDLPSFLPQKKLNKIVIITDHIVKKRYGIHLDKKLKQAGFDSLLISFPSGEKSKNDRTKQKIENTLLSHRCDRDTLIVALGGGVVGDLAGFVAATFLRSVAYMQIPTTLLAMVDSSIGGKTAINTKHGKNLIGTIYHPLCVIVDVSTLKTLSKKARINGLVEAIKLFLTHDAKSFRYIETHLQQVIEGEEEVLKNVILRSVKIKARIVRRDENEKGERNLLNFGHTMGHALEKISNYKLLHGYAVAYGILVEATISYQLGFLNLTPLLRIKNIMSALGIHAKELKKFNLTSLLKATRQDKKVRFNNVHYTLLQNIGKAYYSKGKYTHPIPDETVKKAFKHITAERKYVG